MLNPTDDDRVNRRTVLKSIGVGSIAALGTSSVGAARTNSEISTDLNQFVEEKRAARAFAADDAIQQALRDQATPVREMLATEGISLDLETGTFDEIRTFPDRQDGVATAHIVAERDDDSRYVRLHVLPQADRAFAVEKTESNIRRFDADSDGPTPAEFCETSSGCTDDLCDCVAPTPDCDPNCDKYWEKEECCTYSDGSTSCDTLDRYCSSDCATC